MTLLAILLGVAVLLTHTLFSSRQAMMGGVCTMFWAIAGGDSVAQKDVIAEALEL